MKGSIVLDSMVKIKLKRFNRRDEKQKWSCEQTGDTDPEPSVAEISIEEKRVLSYVEHNAIILTDTGGYKCKPKRVKRFKRPEACVEEEDEIPNTKGSTTSQSTEQIALKFFDKVDKNKKCTCRNTNCNPECSMPEVIVPAEKKVSYDLTTSAIWTDTGGCKLVSNKEEPLKRIEVCVVANEGEFPNPKCAMVNETCARDLVVNKTDSDQVSDCMIIETPDSSSSDSMDNLIASIEFNGDSSNDSDLDSIDIPPTYNDPTCTLQNQAFEKANIALEIYEKSVLSDDSKHTDQFIVGDTATTELVDELVSNGESNCKDEITIGENVTTDLVDEEKVSSYELNCADEFNTGYTATTGMSKAEIISNAVLKNGKMLAYDKATTDMVESLIPACLPAIQTDAKFVHPQNKPDFLNAMLKIPIWNASAGDCRIVSKPNDVTTSSIPVSGLSEVSIAADPNVSSNTVNLAKTPSTISTLTDFVQGFTSSDTCIIPTKDTQQTAPDYGAGEYLKESSDRPNNESVETQSNPCKILKLDKGPMVSKGNECPVLPPRSSNTVQDNINRNPTETPSTITPLTTFVRDPTASNSSITPVKVSQQTASDYRAGGYLKESSDHYNNESLGNQTNLDEILRLDKRPVVFEGNKCSVPPPRSSNTVQDNINRTWTVEPISTYKPTSEELPELTTVKTSVATGDGSTSRERVRKRPETYKRKIYARCDFCDFEAISENRWRIHMVSYSHKKKKCDSTANRLSMGDTQPPFANPFPVPPATTLLPPRSKSELECRNNVPPQQSNQELLQRHPNPSAFTRTQNPSYHLGAASSFESTHSVTEGRSDVDCKDPFRVYRCCVCQVFSTDSFKELEEHVRKDRISKETNHVDYVYGVYTCRLCQVYYGDGLTMQAHASSTKHLERLQYMNHLSEGGPIAAKRFVIDPAMHYSTHVCCNACDVHAPTLEALAAHGSDSRHKDKIDIWRFLANFSALIDHCYCKLCGYTFKSKADLVKHTDNTEHVTYLKVCARTELENIFFVKEKAPVKRSDTIQEPEAEIGRNIGSEGFQTNKKSKYLNHDLLSPGVPSFAPSSTSTNVQHGNSFNGYPTENPTRGYHRACADSRILNIETEQLYCFLCRQRFPEMYILISHLLQVHKVDNTTIRDITSIHEAQTKARMKSALPIERQPLTHPDKNVNINRHFLNEPSPASLPVTRPIVEKKTFTNGDGNNCSSWNTPVAEPRTEKQSITHRNTNFYSSCNPSVTAPRIESQPIVNKDTNYYSSWKYSVPASSTASHSVTEPGIGNHYTTEQRIENQQHFENGYRNANANYYSSWKPGMPYPSNASHFETEPDIGNYYTTEPRIGKQPPFKKSPSNASANYYSSWKQSTNANIASHSIIEPGTRNHCETFPRIAKQSIINGDKNINANSYSRSRRSVSHPDITNNSTIEPSFAGHSVTEPRFANHSVNGAGFANLYITEPGIEKPILDGDKNINVSNYSSWKPSVHDPSDVSIYVIKPTSANPSAADVDVLSSTTCEDLHESKVEPLNISIVDYYSLQNADSDIQRSPVDLRNSPLPTANSVRDNTFTRPQIYTSESELESLSEDDDDFLIRSR